MRTATEPAPEGLIARVIAACAANPWLTLLAVAAAALWGFASLRTTPLDAIPDLSDTQVIVFTEWPGRSPDLVEDQITYPLSATLLSAPQVAAVRGQSMFGMSFVTVLFDDGTDPYWARTRVLETMAQVQAALPDGVAPELGPDATGVGWVFQYALVDRSGGTDLQELRALQDWDVRLALQSVEGVAEVASVGGFVEELQVQLDPDRMLARGVSVRDVEMAVMRSNEDVGGRTLEIAGHEHVVRGRGYLRGEADLELVPVALGPDGAPVLVRDLGWVVRGPGARRGFAELDGEGEVVGGIVIMRQGQNALTVIEAVKERLREVERGLPEGVEIVITYDRSDLIERAIDTLRHTLLEEMIVVSIVIFLFLLHARSALVPILTLPVAVLLAFVPMSAQGLTANIMSLGGSAVAIGAMVDASIILIENVHKKLEEWEDAGRPGERAAVVVRGMQEVGPSLFFSLLVITASFLPVFTLEATEGRLFKPLAYTKTYSMGFSAVLAVTMTPALVALLVRGRVRREEHNPLNRLLVWLYAPVVRLCVRLRWLVIAAAALAVALTAPVFFRLGTEFMPPLNEGALLFMPTAPPGMGATEAQVAMGAMGRQIRQIPEVVSVFGKMGRARTATDPAPIGMAETTIVLEPRERWRPGLTWEQLVAELDAAVQVPGMPNLWWMPIQTRTEMLATGIRSPLGVQVFGDTIEEIEAAAVRIEQALAAIPGTRSAFAERATGGFYLDVVVDRERAARYGLGVGDVNDVVEAAIGGMPVTEIVDGRERYDVTVRYARDLREDPDALARVLVPTATGAQVPLDQVARIAHAVGPPMIRSEGGKLVGFVFVDPGEVPLGDYVALARAEVERLRLPGVRVDYAGQFEHLQRAQARLVWVVPLTLAAVALLLWLNTRSLAETAVVLLAVPFSLVGAVWLLWALDYHLSVAVWVGLIALAGLDAETAVVMLLYLKLAWERRRGEGSLRTFDDLTDAIVEGAARRVRPKLMTVLTTMLGLLPILWSTGAGADVMKRIAAPMVGGLVTSFLLELTVYPAIFAVWRGRGLR
jgi:Cu(I)/Ag(I) efflux system membrane protein CusA/SilA